MADMSLLPIEQRNVIEVLMMGLFRSPVFVQVTNPVCDVPESAPVAMPVLAKCCLLCCLL